ncbi:MAG TPA: ATP-binding cassette domain-containing protein [Acidimicrobiia bacterium]
MTDSPAPALPVAVQVEGLHKRFGDVVALDGVDFSVPTGTVLGLLGPNGAGKTTAVRVLTTIIRPDAGRAEVLGVDVTRKPDAVRARIGLAGQYAAVDENLTGRENLQLIGRLTHLPGRVIDGRADELLERFELTDAADRRARTYSGGMRRRLDLSAALVHRPPVLFLDEPTTGLDPHSRRGLWGVIGDLVAEGTTVLLTTQYLEEADQLADHIVVVDRGQIIASGTAPELKADLGATIVEIGLADPAEAHRALAPLAPFGLRDPELDGTTVRLELADGTRALVGALRALDNDGFEPAAIAVREPSLDDVFLSLTGRKADYDEQAPDDVSQRGAA